MRVSKSQEGVVFQGTKIEIDVLEKQHKKYSVRRLNETTLVVLNPEVKYGRKEQNK